MLASAWEVLAQEALGEVAADRKEAEGEELAAQLGWVRDLSKALAEAPSVDSSNPPKGQVAGRRLKAAGRLVRSADCR